MRQSFNGNRMLIGGSGQTQKPYAPIAATDDLGELLDFIKRAADIALQLPNLEPITRLRLERISEDADLEIQADYDDRKGRA